MRFTRASTRSYFQLTVLLTGLMMVLPTFADTEQGPEQGAAQIPPLEKQKDLHDHPLTNSAGTAEADPESASGSGEEAAAGSGVAAENKGPQPEGSQETPRLKKRNPLALKPGQKLKIAGFAEQKPVIVVDPDAAAPASPAYHRAQMRLTGSMCYACLHEFQEKLLEVYGVERVRVEKSEQTSISAYAPVLPNWADAIVFFDSSKVDLQDLRAYMRANAYFPYKVSEKTVDSVPPENQKKI